MKHKIFLAALLAIAHLNLFGAVYFTTDGIKYSTYDCPPGEVMVISENSNYSEYDIKPNYPNLTEVTIPSSVIYNGTPYRVTSIGYYAFNDCPVLTSVTLPNSIRTISRDAFARCRSLTSVTLVDGLIEIQEGAFENCIRISTITIPSTVTKIGGDAFEGCSSLQSVKINCAPSMIQISSLAFPSHTRVTFSDGTVKMNGSIVTQKKSTPQKNNSSSLNKQSSSKESKPAQQSSSKKPLSK